MYSHLTVLERVMWLVFFLLSDRSKYIVYILIYTYIIYFVLGFILNQKHMCWCFTGWKYCMLESVVNTKAGDSGFWPYIKEHRCVPLFISLFTLSVNEWNIICMWHYLTVYSTHLVFKYGLLYQKFQNFPWMYLIINVKVSAWKVWRILKLIFCLSLNVSVDYVQVLGVIWAHMGVYLFFCFLFFIYIFP